MKPGHVKAPFGPLCTLRCPPSTQPLIQNINNETPKARPAFCVGVRASCNEDVLLKLSPEPYALLPTSRSHVIGWRLLSAPQFAGEPSCPFFIVRLSASFPFSSFSPSSSLKNCAQQLKPTSSNRQSPQNLTRRSLTSIPRDVWLWIFRFKPVSMCLGKPKGPTKSLDSPKKHNAPKHMTAVTRGIASKGHCREPRGRGPTALAGLLSKSPGSKPHNWPRVSVPEDGAEDQSK